MSDVAKPKSKHRSQPRVNVESPAELRRERSAPSLFDKGALAIPKKYPYDTVKKCQDAVLKTLNCGVDVASTRISPDDSGASSNCCIGGGVVGNHSVDVFKLLIAVLSGKNAGVLIKGPSGCGKSLVIKQALMQLGVNFNHVIVVHPALYPTGDDAIRYINKCLKSTSLPPGYQRVDALEAVSTTVTASQEASAATTPPTEISSSTTPKQQIVIIIKHTEEYLLRAQRLIYTALEWVLSVPCSAFLVASTYQLQLECNLDSRILSRLHSVVLIPPISSQQHVMELFSSKLKLLHFEDPLFMDFWNKAIDTLLSDPLMYSLISQNYFVGDANFLINWMIWAVLSVTEDRPSLTREHFESTLYLVSGTRDEDYAQVFTQAEVILAGAACLSPTGVPLSYIQMHTIYKKAYLLRNFTLPYFEDSVLTLAFHGLRDKGVIAWRQEHRVQEGARLDWSSRAVVLCIPVDILCQLLCSNKWATQAIKGWLEFHS
ncbi:hypothetical protein Pelo_14507 [Pelomyxa schiedti]|nr:hypothetical protein Pelo_14507 [Pelomyxa schiedti]